ILGGSSARTRLTVDGTSVVNSIEGGSQQNFSQEVVGEFQISTVNFDLSTGVTGVGAVNIVTRGGGNEFHGSGYYFFRDHNMAAFPALRRDANNPDPFFARRQAGFYVGGPIKRDKLFFFFNYERNNQDSVFTVQPQSASFARFAQIVPSPFNGKQHSTRFDYRINDKHSMFLRYSHDGNDNLGPRDGAPMPSYWLKNVNYADQSLLAVTSVFSSNLVNDFRFAYGYWQNRNDTPSASDCVGNCIGLGLPQIDVTGAGFLIGNNFNAPQGRDLRRFTLNDNVSWQKGKHRFRFGGEYEPGPGTGYWAFCEPACVVLYSPEIVGFYNSQVPAAARIQIPASFNTAADILQLPLAGFSTGIGDPRQPPPFQLENVKWARRTHVYWQDVWRMRPNLTLNYGLAYSYEATLANHDLDAPAYLRPIFGDYIGPSKKDTNNFSPSLGFSWSPNKDNKTVIRGGAGIYYDTQLLWERLQERGLIGPRGNGRVPIGGALVPNPIPGIPGVPVGTPLAFTSVPTQFRGAHLIAVLPQLRTGIQQLVGDPNNKDLSVRNIEVFKQGVNLQNRAIKVPYSMQYNLGVQRELRRDTVLTADFVWRQFV
ncbi:MAG: hypothetical protein ACRD96_09380, partial [Bryobacteraceae bacterium]